MAYLLNIHTGNPEYKHTQDEISKFMQSALTDDVDFKRKIKIVYSKSGLDYRYSCLPDFDSSKDRVLYNGENPSIQERLKIYNKNAFDLGTKVLKKSIVVNGISRKKEITHLITISCTGMCAPGLDIWLMEKLGLETSVSRTSVNFMGCYAAIHGLKQANDIANANPDAVVAIVDVELCTLHFRYSTTYDDIISSSIFADGAAACLVIGNNIQEKWNRPKSLKMDRFYSKVAFNGKDDMAWHIVDDGFLMKLSSYVKDVVGGSILDFCNEAKGDMDVEYVIHPGGKSILNEAYKNIDVSEKAKLFSEGILANYGNMSSATILFVLQKWFETYETIDKPLLAMAFGPGITMESVLLSKV